MGWWVVIEVLGLFEASGSCQSCLSLKRLCVHLRGGFGNVIEDFLERSQWNRKLPTLSQLLKSKGAAMSRLVVARKSRLRGLLLR